MDKYLDRLRGVLKHDKVYFAVSTEKKWKWFSRAIEAYQGSKYSHALAIYYSYDINDYLVTSAHQESSQLDTLEIFYEDSIVVRLWEVDCDEKQLYLFKKKAAELDGIQYSDRQIIGFVIAKILGLFKNPLSNKNKGIICSEHVDKLGQAVGLSSASQIVNFGQEMLSPKDNVKSWEYLSRKIDRIREIFLYETDQ